MDLGISPISELISGCNSFIPIIVEVSWNTKTPVEDVLKLVKIKGEQCVILDQYCLLPKRPCTDANLNKETYCTKTGTSVTESWKKQTLSMWQWEKI